MEPNSIQARSATIPVASYRRAVKQVAAAHRDGTIAALVMAVGDYAGTPAGAWAHSTFESFAALARSRQALA